MPRRSAVAAPRSKRASVRSGAMGCSIQWARPEGRSSRSRASARAGRASTSPRSSLPEATITADRRTTPLFGLGLVDAVPDSTFYAIAYEEKFHPDGIAGRVSVVTKIVDRPAGGRQVRVEVPEPQPVSVLGRRLRERDGHHQSRVSRRELSAGRLRLVELQSGARRQRRRHGSPGVHGLHDVPRSAAARPDHGAGGAGRAGLPRDRLQRLPPDGDPDGIQPDRRAQQGDVPPLLGLPAPRRGRASATASRRTSRPAS